MNNDIRLPMFDIVMKLNGPIEPIGESQEDARRLENIKRLTALVDDLLSEIDDAAAYSDSPRASEKAIGTHAHQFLSGVKDEC